MQKSKFKINSGFIPFEKSRPKVAEATRFSRGRSQTGFTLIELLLYVSLSAIILLSVSIFTMTLLQARVKNQVIAEVEQTGMQVAHIVTQGIRNASAIHSPGIGTSAAMLSIATLDSGNNPTVFDLASGTIQITEGASSTIALTNSNLVTVSVLNFQNLTRPDTSGTIRTSFIVTFKNLSGRNEYNYSKTFYASASLR